MSTATELTEATYQLCLRIAPILGGEAIPYDSEDNKPKVYYNPMPCMIKLKSLIKGLNPALSIRVIQNKQTHVKIHGLYPYSERLKRSLNPDNSCGDRSITASRMKSDFWIARQIQRRFLPEYLQQFDNCTVRMFEQERKMDLAEAEKILLKHVFGAPTEPYYGTFVIGERLDGGDSIRIRCHGGRINIEWDCDCDTAVKIGQLYSQLKNEGRQKGNDNG